MADATRQGSPSWTYTKDYYALALAGTGMEIVTDPVKGKGLHATRTFAPGTTVHEETALCCSQNMDDFQAAVPVCPFCLRSFETPRAQAARNTRRKKTALALPHPELHTPQAPVPCLWEAEGCRERFCSARCRESAMRQSHWVSCTGRMTTAQRSALAAYMEYDWVQNGVDFSDTAVLGLRIVAQTLCAHRLHHQPLERAFEPYAQLIRSPITSFFFAYLLVDDVPTAASSAAAIAAYAAAFAASKGDPMSIPAVKDAYADEPRSKAAFCAESVVLLHGVFDMDAEERDFVTALRWSELMGAVLLNGQERSPPSPYETHRELVCSLEGGEAAMNAFEAAALQKGGGVKDVAELARSSRGQGIYGVGCLFNHSCDPNLSVQYAAANDETLAVAALRDVAVGEELTISYIDTELPVAVRQQQLFEHYLFECGCPRCVRESAAAAAA